MENHDNKIESTPKNLVILETSGEKAESSGVEKKLLTALTDRLSSPEVIQYESKDSSALELPIIQSFLMLDVPEMSLALWSNLQKDRDGVDISRSVELAWIKPNSSEVGSINFEDKRMKSVNHHRTFEGGVLREIDLDNELQRWKKSGGLNCGLLFSQRDDHGSAYLGGMNYEGVSEVSDEEIENLIGYINRSVTNAERMKAAVNFVAERAKPTGLSHAYKVINFLTPIPSTNDSGLVQK